MPRDAPLDGPVGRLTDTLTDRVIGTVIAVARDDVHRFSKPVVDAITLIEDHGIEGDVHAGATVRHRSARNRRPELPNLRQVHLLHAELLDGVADEGFTVAPGQLGENITTRGVPLLDLPEGTVLRLGDRAAVRVTGLRNPCRQIDDFAPGLMARMLARDPDGTVHRLSGVMSVVVAGGVVRAGDAVTVELPAGPPTRLRLV
jgi:MOSC domain-containing protein YiiM